MTRTLLVGQSGGATAVTNATLAGIIDAARTNGGFDRILGMRYGITGLLNRSYVDLTELSAQRVKSIRITPGAALGTSRRKLSDDDLSVALSHARADKIDAIVLIGGNDSADSAHQLSKRENDLPVVLAPKTIDNDLHGTDHCPGFGSAARLLANVVRDATYDTISAPDLYPVKIIEIGGRDAGWLSAGASLGIGPTETDICPLLFFPERPQESIEAVVEVIGSAVRDRGWVVCVLPETLRDATGQHLSRTTPGHVDSFGHSYHRSAADAIAHAAERELGIRVRVERPGSAARAFGSLVSPVDREEAYLLGRNACRLVFDGFGDKMATLERVSHQPYECAVGYCPLDRVANRVRPLDEPYIGSDAHSTTEAFRTYALPLLGTSPFPAYGRL